jgi:spermidine synthase
VTLRHATAWVALIFALSGVSALIYEIVWVRLLSHLLGGTTFAISAVLACFMGGLALGSSWVGHRSDRVPSPLRTYALLELAIAITAACVPLVIHFAKPLYIAAVQVVPSTLMPGVGVVIVFVLLLPATFCMGGTLPVLSRFLVRRHDRLGRQIGLLYAVNTLGAVTGAFLTGFVLIPQMGLLASLGVAAAGNLVAALVALAIARRETDQHSMQGEGSPTKPKHRPRSPDAPELSQATLLIVLALSGFAALGFELYWTRALSRFLGNTTYAFSAMLTTFLIGLSAGGWVGGRVADGVRSPARVLGAVQLGIAVSAAATVPLIWNILTRLDTVDLFSAMNMGWMRYLGMRFLAASTVMFVPTFLSGMAFPLANRVGVDDLQRLGARVGRYYAANTIGAVVGSLAAAFVFLPLLGVRRSLLATAILSAGVGTVVLLVNRRRSRADPVAVLGVLALLAVAAPALHRTAGRALSDTQAVGDVTLYEREDHTAETRVYRKQNGELHMSVDGRHIGGTGLAAARKQKALAHVPLALSPSGERVLAVGLGSGITLGSLALYANVRELTCVEIVPGVIDAAQLFAAHHGDVLRDPRVRIVQGDGVQYLRTTHERFDVISSDSKLNPEFAGNSSILSLDYYELCRDRLTDDGVMMQWMPMHVPNGVLRLVTRTFVKAFPYVEMFWIDPAEIFMAGSRSPIVFDLERWKTRSAASRVRTDLESVSFEDPYVLMTSRVAGRAALAAAVGDETINTFMRPRYEFRVVREYRVKTQVYHENDNLRWLAALYTPSGFRVAGDINAERLRRFRASTRHFLLGFSTGGGTARLAGGRAQFEAGLALNPEDGRLSRVLERIDRESKSALPQPTSAARWMQQGLVHLDAGRGAEALVCFERAIAIDPDARDAHYNRVLALRRLGRTAAARARVERLTRDFPRDARGWSLHGENLAASNDLAGALAALQTAVELDPSTASFRNNLAVTLVRLERFAEAAEAFAVTHNIDPLFPDAAFFAAASYSRAGLPSKAAEWMEICLDRNLVHPERFLTDPNFEELRSSEHWDGDHIEKAAASWQARQP